MAQIRLGELLVRAQVVSEAQLQAALHEQRRWGGRLGTLLVRMNLVTEDLLVKALSRQLQLPEASLAAQPLIAVPPALRGLIDRTTCERLLMLPISVVSERRVVVVAAADPLNVVAVDELSRRLGARVELAIAGETELSLAIARAFGHGAIDLVDDRASFDGDLSIVDNAGRAVRQGHSSPVGAGAILLTASYFSAPEPPALPPSNRPPATGPAFAPAFAPAAVPTLVRVPDEWVAVAAQQRRCVRALAALLVERGLMAEAELAAAIDQRLRALDVQPPAHHLSSMD
jgi:hypothetical protein